MVLLLILVIVVIDVTEQIEDFTRTSASVWDIIRYYYFNLIPFYANLLSPVCVFISVIF
jgi:lipopolysaccharide export system permease protein